MRVFFAGLAAFLVAAVAGWMAMIALYVIGIELRWWFDRDGGGAMNFAFIIGPIVGLICGVAGAFGAARWMRRREQGSRSAPPPARDA